MTTINQITNIVKEITDKHHFINDFGVGQLEDRELNFPYLWVIPGTSTITGTQGNELSTVQYTMTFYVMDRNSKGNDKITNEIISDSHGILCGVIAEFQNHPKYQELRILIQDNITLTPAIGTTDKDVSGHMADITFKVPFNLCLIDIPLKNDGVE